MTKRVISVPLRGGPRDGQLYHSITKWPMYLSATGNSLPAAMGDRTVRGTSKIKGCYVQQRAGGKVIGYTWHITRAIVEL
jgi:hypothetical protein